MQVESDFKTYQAYHLFCSVELWEDSYENIENNPNEAITAEFRIGANFCDLVV